MNWEAMFKSDYVKAIELGTSKPTWTIKHVNMCKLFDEKTNKEKDKGVVFFHEHNFGWVLCKTTAICLAAMFGPETDQWAGKRVTLYATQVSVGKEKKPGIRVIGSPDIPAPKQVEIKLPRKRPFVVTMQKVGAQPPPTQHQAKPAPPPAPPPPPASDPMHDPNAEPPPDAPLPGAEANPFP